MYFLGNFIVLALFLTENKILASPIALKCSFLRNFYTKYLLKSPTGDLTGI